MSEMEKSDIKTLAAAWEELDDAGRAQLVQYGQVLLDLQKRMHEGA